MDDRAVGGSVWSLDQSMAVLGGGGLAGGVDVSRPELGMRDLRVGDSPLAGEWFCVGRDAEQPLREPTTGGERSWPLALAEVYVRGADLVAAYQPTSDWPYSPQIYWRACHLDSVPGVIGSMSLLLSVQTHLLDTYPRIVVESRIHAESAVQLAVCNGKRTEPTDIGRDLAVEPAAGICCILRRLKGERLSYAEFMPASDFRAVWASCDDAAACRVQWKAFAEFLEKGVIRRARVHCAFLRSENDLETAATCCAAIERDSLPLTT